jgi:hypothetical protein
VTPSGAGALLLAAAAPLAAQAAPATVPAPRPALAAVDHLVWAVADLDAGIAWFEAKTGVRAVFGGSHPGRGTRNALLSLGAGQYLEIVAPDPAQPESKSGDAAGMARLPQPLLGGWAVGSSDLAAELARAQAGGLDLAGPFPGGRDRPDGRTLSWQTAFVSSPLAAVLPFLIEWGAESPHPSSDAPLVGALQSLVLVHPEPEAVARALAALGLDCPVVKGDAPALRARIATPRGALDL